MTPAFEKNEGTDTNGEKLSTFFELFELREWKQVVIMPPTDREI